MIVVNLCGAPGAGKSTGAAYVFSKLKMAGVNAELVTEFAKDKTWEKNHKVFENQLYMLAKQYFRLTRCEDQVDVIVTDSPLLLSLAYNTDTERLGENFEKLVVDLFNSYDNMNYFVNRVKPYNKAGRNQTEEESDKLSKVIRRIFKDCGCKVTEINGDIKGYDKIVNDVLQRILMNDIFNDDRGQWIFEDGWVTCSKCGAQPYKGRKNIDFDNLDEVCPECGARMD